MPKLRRAPTNLTEAKIRALKPGDYVQGDTQIPGFSVRMRPSGVAAYIVMKRLPGETTPSRITLGRTAELTLEEARDKARLAIAAVREGVNLNAARRRDHERAARQREEARRTRAATGFAADSFGAIAMRYIDRECPRLARGAELAATIRRELLPAFGDRPFAELRRRDLNEVVYAIIDRGRPGAAHKAREIGKRIASWDDDEELIDHNPFLGGRNPVRRISRDRTLSAAEIAALWRACQTMGAPFGAMIMLLLATAQRRGEITWIENAELDLERRLWTIPAAKAKNRKEHLVPLSSLAVEILAAVPELVDGRYVFSTREDTRVSGFSKAKRRADQLSGVADWTLHDLRRTATTGMAELKVDRRVISKLLNHTPRGVIGVTAIYDRYEYLDERAEAMERWAERLRGIVNPPPANVVPLRGAAA
jgi:integrase